MKFLAIHRSSLKVWVEDNAAAISHALRNAPEAGPSADFYPIHLDSENKPILGDAVTLEEAPRVETRTVEREVLISGVEEVASSEKMVPRVQADE